MKAKSEVRVNDLVYREDDGVYKVFNIKRGGVGVREIGVPTNAAFVPFDRLAKIATGSWYVKSDDTK